MSIRDRCLRVLSALEQKRVWIKREGGFRPPKERDPPPSPLMSGLPPPQTWKGTEAISVACVQPASEPGKDFNPVKFFTIYDFLRGFDALRGGEAPAVSTGWSR